MLNVALYQPEIPPNTGNIIRLAANCGCALHLIKPLGFELDDKRCRRAGLDYHEFATLQTHETYADFLAAINPDRLFACSTKGTQIYSANVYQVGDTFLFGPETRGLPVDILQSLPSESVIKIPMLPNSRSLNLSNATAVIVYEALRQLKFQSCL